MAGKLDELSLAIGALRSDVENLAETVRRNQEVATEEHRLVHDTLVELSGSVRSLNAKVAIMEPLTDDYREKRAEDRGAKRIAGTLYVAFGGIAGAIASRLLDFFTVRPPHP